MIYVNDCTRAISSFYHPIITETKCNYIRRMRVEPDFNPEHVRDLFNRMSGSYERVNYITSFGFSLRWRRQFVQALPSSKEKLRVLDLMTGMGETWHAVKKHYPECEFSALDFSEGMLKPAKQKNEKDFGSTIQILQQDLLNNSLPANHYDVVLSAFGLKTFNEEQLSVLAKEIKRILKPGGRFSFIEVSSPQNAFLRAMYKLHLKHVIPVCGWMFLGNPSEYRMLWRYTEKFRNAERTVQLFRDAGLQTEPANYFYGCATGVTGMKR